MLPFTEEERKGFMEVIEQYHVIDGNVAYYVQRYEATIKTLKERFEIEREELIDSIRGYELGEGR